MFGITRFTNAQAPAPHLLESLFIPLLHVATRFVTNNNVIFAFLYTVYHIALIWLVPPPTMTTLPSDLDAADQRTAQILAAAAATGDIAPIREIVRVM